MIEWGRILASGTTLVLVIAMTRGDLAARFFDDIADARSDLAKLANRFADAQKSGGKVDSRKVQEMTRAMKKKYDDLNPIMAAYKPTKKGGNDGIEKRLFDLAHPSRKPLSKEQLLQEKELLIRIAMYNFAMHEVLKEFGPKLKNGPAAKQWNKFTAEMKEGSESLVKAVTATDPAGLKKAAGKINTACKDCHAVFR